MEEDLRLLGVWSTDLGFLGDFNGCESKSDLSLMYLGSLRILNKCLAGISSCRGSFWRASMLTRSDFSMSCKWSRTGRGTGVKEGPAKRKVSYTLKRRSNSKVDSLRKNGVCRIKEVSLWRKLSWQKNLYF